MLDPHAAEQFSCPRGHDFEDLAVCLLTGWAWCPACDHRVPATLHESRRTVGPGDVPSRALSLPLPGEGSA